MLPETQTLFHRGAVLLLLLAAQTASVDFPDWDKHDAANIIIGLLFSSARAHGNAVCDSGQALTDAAQAVKNAYIADGHKLTQGVGKTIEIKTAGTGSHGVVFLVKVGTATRAMKVTACGEMQAEIFAQEKLAGEPWVIQMHGWGRSSEPKPKWEYYIMDQIGATLEKTAQAGPSFIDSKQLQEVMRLVLEAAKDMRAKHGLAHTDLKDDNIAFMTGETKQIKLIDFGLVESVTDAHALAAYSDFWRVAETIEVLEGNAFSGGRGQPIFKILTDEVVPHIFDGKPLAQGKNVFPSKGFFNDYLHGKVMDKFVDLKWIKKSANGKKETVLPGLFSKLP